METYLHQANAAYIEGLIAKYEEDPASVDPTWRFFFEGMALGNGAHHALREAAETDDLEFEFRVLRLIQAYREMGYLIADVNPLDRTPKSHPLLALSTWGLSDADLSRPARVCHFVGMSEGTLADIVAALKKSYCGVVTVEYSHIDEPASRQWIQERVESHALLHPLDSFWKKRALEKLSESEVLDTLLHKRFVGQKRFSGEGNDTAVPMLDYLINLAADRGAKEFVIGMAHRGRLSVLASVLGKDLKEIFAEFSGNLETDASPGDGDVKYHLGYSGDHQTISGQRVHVALVPNPSHLEAVNAVVMGIVRAKQKLAGDTDRSQTLALLFHGDASFSGQGSIYETLNMSELAGYTIGGTIHIVINNQIGFTTTPKDGRSTPNATDVAKMLEVPIFRVNADEPEAALQCIALALDYRATFKRDVFIDLIGYRRYGHNEGDEPAFTQPLLYQKIAAQPRVRALYLQRLIDEGSIDDAEAAHLLERLHNHYEAALEESRKAKVARDTPAFQKQWEGFRPVTKSDDLFKEIKTGVGLKDVQAIGRELATIPPGFSVHPKIERILNDRQEMLEEKRGLDWGCAEALSFGSLIREGYAIRLAGQDSERGTFSHRHSVLYDVKDGKRYVPLNRLATERADFEVINSLLSEFAAMGFEFGQSLANPNKLTLWEAQFGDFANGAQVIIDQFLVSSAIKWQRYSGLVLLLPHGSEGQGPEHSSARLERYLQACAQNNIQVASLTTPAQYFHILRRQMHRKVRLPLILMTPKSLLRHPKAISPLADLSTDDFHEILDDVDAKARKAAKRVVIVSGKLYYELLKGRDEGEHQDVSLIRLEQFYPFPEKILSAIVSAYAKAKEIIWCQEEPQNMGGWNFVRDRLRLILKNRQELIYVGRPEQSSPSGGYLHIHEAEQLHIVREALGAL